jgi:hypothetical protein
MHKDVEWKKKCYQSCQNYIYQSDYQRTVTAEPVEPGLNTTGVRCSQS